MLGCVICHDRDNVDASLDEGLNMFYDELALVHASVRLRLGLLLVIRLDLIVYGFYWSTRLLQDWLQV